MVWHCLWQNSHFDTIQGNWKDRGSVNYGRTDLWISKWNISNVESSSRLYSKGKWTLWNGGGFFPPSSNQSPLTHTKKIPAPLLSTKNYLCKWVLYGTLVGCGIRLLEDEWGDVAEPVSVLWSRFGFVQEILQSFLCSLKRGLRLVRWLMAGWQVQLEGVP